MEIVPVSGGAAAGAGALEVAVPEALGGGALEGGEEDLDEVCGCEEGADDPEGDLALLGRRALDLKKQGDDGELGEGGGDEADVDGDPGEFDGLEDLRIGQVLGVVA